MLRKMEKVLFVTSFIPVAAFKIIARVGDATWGQAKAAVVIGFFLAVIQYVSARRILKYNTYLEKAFLGFLLAGTFWVYLLPGDLPHVFVDHSVALLYLTLFFMSSVPQLLGFDPFTYAVARQWYPEAVWGTPDFRLINFRITYVWAGVFGACFLSSFLGKGKPLYAIIIPFVLCIGIGIVFSRKYPDFYLRRKYRVSPEAAAAVPGSAKEIIEGMPAAFDSVAAGDLRTEIQFDISGDGGGKWVVSIAEGRCQVRSGDAASPALTIESPGEIWVKIARGEIDRPKALIEGLYKIKGDMNILAGMPRIFGARTKG